MPNICRTVKSKDKSTMLSLNSSQTSAAYMRRWTGSPLFQVMACRLFGEPEPLLTYCQMDHEEQTSVKFESKYKIFHF